MAHTLEKPNKLTKVVKISTTGNLSLRWKPTSSHNDEASVLKGQLKIYVILNHRCEAGRQRVKRNAEEIAAFVAVHRNLNVPQRGEVVSQLMALVNDRILPHLHTADDIGMLVAFDDALPLPQKDLLQYPLLDPTHAPLAWLRYELCQLQIFNSLLTRALPLFDLFSCTHFRQSSVDLPFHASSRNTGSEPAWNRKRIAYVVSKLLSVKHLLTTRSKINLLSSVLRHSRQKRSSKKVVVKRRHDPTRSTIPSPHPNRAYS